MPARHTIRPPRWITPARRDDVPDRGCGAAQPQRPRSRTRPGISRGLGSNPAAAAGLRRGRGPFGCGFAALAIWLAILPTGISAKAQSWTDSLAAMPVSPAVHYLDRTNCVAVMLNAFQSNAVVKALIFMPGATDEFYMFRRAHAQLAGDHLTLLDAIEALTNQTKIQATFRPPFLLLHTGEDYVEPEVSVKDANTEMLLKEHRAPSHVLCNDRDWDYLQPLLRWSLKVDIRPWHGSTGSWHFYRHSFAGWNLTGWEALEAAALAGKSRFTVKRKSVVFEVDRRIKSQVPSLQSHVSSLRTVGPVANRARPVGNFSLSLIPSFSWVEPAHLFQEPL